ncbi:MAG: glycosyltransferase family 4 protein [Bacteroidota bacterium]|nr:glycosyltransferase family 4 protein [Bacteroidota bacterium]
MKRVLILCLHRPNRSPSQRFRFEQYLPYLEQNGYSFEFSYLLDERDDRIFYMPGHTWGKARIVLKSIAKRWREIRKAARYDLVFVQREAFMLGTAYFERKIARKVPLIFDFDDSIWLQNVSDANKRLNFLKDAAKTSRLIKCAKEVFAGNEYLAAYARQYNTDVVIIPTTIETSVYKQEPLPPSGKICIGWSGSFSTIQHFALAIPALKRIKEKYGDKVYFKIIGDGNYYCQELETKGTPWVEATELRDLSGIDIGIMPLPDDEWAKGKCGLKGLQYMALSIPALMSPVGVNNNIIQHGVNGFLPATEQEWVDSLSKLVESRELRREIGEAGRKTVVDKYSVDVWKEKYLEYFDRVAQKKL